MYARLRAPYGKMRLTTPPPGRDHWYFSAELADPATYRWMLAERLTPPQIIRHSTATIKYGSKFGLELTVPDQWGEISTFSVIPHAERKTLEVLSLKNILNLRPVEQTSVGQNYTGWKWEWSASASQTDPGKLATLAAPVTSSGLRKTDQICGPVKEAFNTAFLLVEGTGGEIADRQRLATATGQFAADWLAFAKGQPRRKLDREVTAEDEVNFNLILFGSPRTNSITARLAKDLPFRFLPNGYGVGEQIVTGENLGLAGIYPHPDHPQRYIVVLDGLYYGLNLPINHKWDLVPDFIVFNALNCTYDGTNEAELAGFFNVFWQVDEQHVYRKPSAANNH